MVSTRLERSTASTGGGASSAGALSARRTVGRFCRAATGGLSFGAATLFFAGAAGFRAALTTGLLAGAFVAGGFSSGELTIPSLAAWGDVASSRATQRVARSGLVADVCAGMTSTRATAGAAFFEPAEFTSAVRWLQPASALTNTPSPARPVGRSSRQTESGKSEFDAMRDGQSVG